MHVAFLTPEFPNSKVINAAGIGTSIKNLGMALVKEGIKVSVFVYGQKSQDIIVENGIKIHLIKSQKYIFFGWLFHRKYIQNYCNSVIKKENISILEAPDWTGITAFMNFKIPLVIRFHGSDSYFCHLENRKQKCKNFLFEKLAVNSAKAYIAPTAFAGQISKRLFKIKRKEIITIHNGLDLKKFINHSPNTFEKGMILYIGTLIRKKGVFELPKIFNNVRKHFPNAKLVLIGSDSFDIKTGSKSTWQLMQDQFIEDDLKEVEYLGKIPYEEVDKYIRRANVCVFPTYAETLGMVTIEAMAMKKAVVNSDFGWSQELIVNGQDGYLMNPENHLLYAKNIVKLLEDDVLAAKIGENARKSAENKFNIERLVKDNIKFYQKIISQNQKSI
ncbi:glycosyltransferase family 4 protein [Flavobacterium hibisci]|uniref:glycosyltransferase family 4 protein n=1 Tax=Flavobacterium hibisci TaxID=1914462 RepID=UPI001CBACDBC|nr:glycosyltransferase family 4 protein [Flavobacterium hibisci]MBZ4041939.1 glycosyltransferase family 4 protein [Flavobacterium hibisci]